MRPRTGWPPAVSVAGQPGASSLESSCPFWEPFWEHQPPRAFHTEWRRALSSSKCSHIAWIQPKPRTSRALAELPVDMEQGWQRPGLSLLGPVLIIRMWRPKTRLAAPAFTWFSRFFEGSSQTFNQLQGWAPTSSARGTKPPYKWPYKQVTGFTTGNWVYNPIVTLLLVL